MQYLLNTTICIYLIKKRPPQVIARIAAHARSLGVVLVTNNVREFERLPGPCLENWAAA